MSNKGPTKVWYLDARCNDLPEDVVSVIGGLWQWREVGNDQYMLKTTLKGPREYLNEGDIPEPDVWKWGPTPEEQIGWVKEFLDVTPLISYLSDKVGEEDDLILHYWW